MRTQLPRGSDVSEMRAQNRMNAVVRASENGREIGMAAGRVSMPGSLLRRFCSVGSSPVGPRGGASRYSAASELHAKMGSKACQMAGLALRGQLDSALGAHSAPRAGLDSGIAGDRLARCSKAKAVPNPAAIQIEESRR
jgi:hypothetical protein